jgi:hypothetical protein
MNGEQNLNQELIPEIPIDFRPETEEAKAIVGFKYADDVIGKRSKQTTANRLRS